MKYLLLIAILAVVLTKPLSERKVVFAMNCGSSEQSKSNYGFIYQKDKNDDQNTIVADYHLNSQVASQIIKYTRESDIYMKERHGYSTFHYKIPVTTSGIYVLILKFAEMYFQQSGMRVFNIKFGDKIVVQGLDVFDKVGRYAAYDEYIEFEYVSGHIFYKGVLCQNAIVNGQLVVQLEKTQFDNPFIHGIVLFQGQLADSDYSEYQDLRQNWAKIYAQEERMKDDEQSKKYQSMNTKRRERVKLRNDQISELDFESEETVQKSEPRMSVKKIITGPIGVSGLYIGLAVLVYIAMKLFRMIDESSSIEANSEEYKEKKVEKKVVNIDKPQPKKVKVNKK